jgi:hypothetical protein
MKKIVLILLLFVVSINFFNAQTTTKGMKYQAVARDLSGLELSNKPISLQIVLVGDIKSSTIYYSEFHNVITNEFGLFSLNIGEGKVDFGEFNTIPWSKENIWIEVNVMKEGDTYYSPLSKSKLLAVPYAYHAATANALANDDKLRKPGVPSQNWSLFGNRNTNPDKDKLGTTDYTDLILVTDNLERLKISADGEVQIKGDLEVGEDLTVGKNVYLNANDNFSPRGETINYGKFTSNGQVTISPSLTGIDNDYEAYPLRVEGSNQGVAIKLNTETPNNDNNFITFFDSLGNKIGRIEGETREEAKNTPEYEFEEGMLIAEEVTATANILESFIPTCTGGFIVSCGISWSSVAMAAADLILASVNLGHFYDLEIPASGVTYQSGSADYAEWLERLNPNEIITPGDIVGVFGGKISKYTKEAQQYMVISTKPAILGNMPKGGQEKFYEKVAFMGQIPVKIRGAVLAGDYILPSGLNDGIGRGVSSDAIKAEEYREIVGVAWSSSLFNEGISIINMAIGLNANDVSKLVTQLENKYDTLEKRIAALENKSQVSEQTESEEVETMSKYEIALEYMPPELNDEIMEEAMLYLKNAYQAKGINMEDHPELYKLFTDSIYKAKIIKETQDRYKKTYQKYLELVKN